MLQIVVWSAAYLLVAVLPLAVSLLGETPGGRGFLVEFGVALGMIGFAMLALQFVTTSRFRWVAPAFGTDAQIQVHRDTGILALVFVLAHPAVLFAADRRYFEFLDPRANLPRAVFLSAATVAVVLLVVLPLWRLSFRLSYEWWRLTHGVLALVVIVVGLAHALQVGHYVRGPAKQATWVLGAGLTIGLLFWTRIARPWRMRRRPWKVAELVPDCPGVYRLVLEADGHAGLAFRAGQYAWLTIGETPFTLQQHPFSFASSDAVPDRIEFGIKEAGDFTTALSNVQPGARAFVEGPYGSFTLDPQVDGAVFVMGGIGVTPALSILQTCRDRRDQRPLLLIYANNRFEEIAFRDELDALHRHLALEIVHVLESPPDGWDGEAGLVTPELLDRHLAVWSSRDPQYFVCGPPAMMEIVERALLDRGAPPWRVAAERFDLV